MRRFLALGTVFLAMLMSSCQILLNPAPGATASSCPTGLWQVSAETLNSIVTSISTSVFSKAAVTVQLNGNGVATSINADGTWILTPDQSGTFNGTPFNSFTISLPNRNSDDDQMELEDAYGLVGAASDTCAGSTLALSFTHSHLDMHFHP